MDEVVVGAVGTEDDGLIPVVADVPVDIPEAVVREESVGDIGVIVPVLMGVDMVEPVVDVPRRVRFARRVRDVVRREVVADGFDAVPSVVIVLPVVVCGIIPCVL